MKIDLGTYEIDIRVKYNGEKRYNARATMGFLNTLSLLYGEAAELAESQYPELGKAIYYRNPAHRIFKALDAEGFYDDVRWKKEVQA